MTRPPLFAAPILAALSIIAPTASADAPAIGRRIVAPPTHAIDATLPDGVRVTLEPNAVGVWMPPGELPTESSAWARGYHFQLVSGEMQVTVPNDRRGERAFTVSTRAGTVTGWRGTVIVRTDRANPDRAVAAAYEGALAVGSNGRGIRVYDGQVVTMKRDADPVRRADAPPPPAWGDSGELALVTDENATDVSFQWSPVARAVAYRVDVATDEAMTDLVRRETTTSTTLKVDASLGTTRYFARVRALDADGIPSRWNEVASHKIVRIALPPGAFVATDGAVVAPQGAPVVLVGHEHLDIAFERRAGDSLLYGLPLRWSAAPNELHADGDSPRIVHLRDRATGAASRFTLAPRTLRARVTVGPARAVWPRDPIAITIALEDLSGRVDPANEEIALEAYVGLAPVRVAWQRDGRVIRGTVPPRDASGPWVVRVNVRDKSGAEIGHGFVEVVSERGPVVAVNTR